MKSFLPLPLLLLLCACAGSLVDHAGAALSGPDAGTPECLQSCTTTSVPDATPYCDGNTCTYKCPDGKFKSAGGCHEASEISAGTSHTCAVVAGEARCWGANDKGQLGRDIPAGGSFVPGAPTALTGTVSHIAAGAAHTCAIVDGNVWCWGDNASGQLGNGTVGNGALAGATPRQVANFSGAVLLAAGGGHTCAATASKTYCWGNNNLGQLGDGANIPEAPRPEATEVPGAAGALALGAGDSHTCAVSAAGVLCWGANGARQLGNNTAVAALSTPGSTSPDALSGASFLGLGWNHSCAGVGDSLSCWGANGAGQVDNSLSDVRSPKGVVSGVRAVVGGMGHTCAITKDQTLSCWGLDTNGQLGAPGRTDVDVSLNSVSVTAAGAQHTCATANLLTYCWGANDRGQLGSNPAVTHASTATPTPISGL
jgi:alpha-tubulin suppressor-like RCC1 family protein